MYPYDTIKINNRYIGISTALNSELWAILQGMELARQCGYGNLIVESNCSVTIDMIKNSLAGAPSNTIVQKIQGISGHFNAVDFHFARRDDNLETDYLVRTCNSTEFEVQVICSPSTSVKQLLLDDNYVISMYK